MVWFNYYAKEYDAVQCNMVSLRAAVIDYFSNRVFLLIIQSINQVIW